MKRPWGYLLLGAPLLLNCDRWLGEGGIYHTRPCVLNTKRFYFVAKISYGNIMTAIKKYLEQNGDTLRNLQTHQKGLASAKSETVLWLKNDDRL